MKEVGQILALFSKKETHQQHNTLYLDLHGIQGDKHYGKNSERSILITSLESYQLTSQVYNISMPYGYLGENILMSYNPYHLPAGSQLQIGEVVLEITQNCTLCNHLAVLDKRLPKLLQHNRGIFAKVIKEGKITTKDTVFLLP